MPKKMLIDATHAEETRVVVVDGNKVEDFDFEAQARRQLAGNIYLAKVTRVEPSLQAAFIEYGGNRHGFLAFNEIHPDYYRIPIADREALIAEERAHAEAMRAQADDDAESGAAPGEDAAAEDAPGMETVEGADDGPVATPEDDASDEEDDEVRDVRKQRRTPRPKRYKIQEVVKTGQVMLVQVVKEERGNKGAALTTYLSLAGRYCVLMPNTARGGGISRKITNAPDRKKLKEIASTMTVPAGAGLIIRTAGSQRTKTEIKRDYEYLQRLWEQIRELTLKSAAPAPIYEEGDLIKRSIRDLYSREIDEVIVEGERGYRTAKEFMRMIMPTHAKNVRLHSDGMPLFAKHQVESTLAAMFNPTVQLPSGGYIVIGITEALVAIDVNSGRATKEGSIEQTATKTNLEAAEEVARQVKLRDLAGLIVIDFIDMDERKNNTAVEKRLKDRLKSDRARIQTGRISGFGLLEMSRQRLRPGMLEATTQPCPHCHGTGLLRSDDSTALAILRALEEEGVRDRSREVLLRAPVGIVNYLFNHKREALASIEARYGMAVRIEGDMTMVSPDWAMEKFKTATRDISRVEAPVVSTDAAMMAEIDEKADAAAEADARARAEADAAEEERIAAEKEARAEARRASRPDEETDEDGKPKKRRRRRRRKGDEDGPEAQGGAEVSDGSGTAEDAESADPSPQAAPEDGTEERPKRKRRSRGGRGRRKKDRGTDGAEAAPAAVAEGATEDAVEAGPKLAPVPETEPPVEAVAEPVVAEEVDLHPMPSETPEPVVSEPEAPAAEPRPVEASDPAPEPEPQPEPAPEPEPTPQPEPVAAEAAPKPKRRGWWSLGR
ncbi:MAG: Rne/Rng family ribonuclease [Paracoccaceae bacterium]